EVGAPKAREARRGQAVTHGELERTQEQVVVERLRGETHPTVAPRALLQGAERGGGGGARRRLRREPGPVRDDALESDEAIRPRPLHGRGVRVEQGIERLVVDDQ